MHRRTWALLTLLVLSVSLRRAASLAACGPHEMPLGATCVNGDEYCGSFNRSFLRESASCGGCKPTAVLLEDKCIMTTVQMGVFGGDSDDSDPEDIEAKYEEKDEDEPGTTFAQPFLAGAIPADGQRPIPTPDSGSAPRNVAKVQPLPLSQQEPETRGLDANEVWGVFGTVRYPLIDCAALEMGQKERIAIEVVNALAEVSSMQVPMLGVACGEALAINYVAILGKTNAMAPDFMDLFNDPVISTVLPSMVHGVPLDYHLMEDVHVGTYVIAGPSSSSTPDASTPIKNPPDAEFTVLISECGADSEVYFPPASVKAPEADASDPTCRFPLYSGVDSRLSLCCYWGISNDLNSCAPEPDLPPPDGDVYYFPLATEYPSEDGSCPHYWAVNGRDQNGNLMVGLASERMGPCCAFGLSSDTLECALPPKSLLCRSAPAADSAGGCWCRETGDGLASPVHQILPGTRYDEYRRCPCSSDSDSRHLGREAIRAAELEELFEDDSDEIEARPSARIQARLTERGEKGSGAGTVGPGSQSSGAAKVAFTLGGRRGLRTRARRLI